MGAKLASAFIDAGLPAPSMRLEALIGGGTNSLDAARIVADLAGTMLPEMERLGVVTAAEMGGETLLERMIQEATSTSSVLVGKSEIGAWTTIPG